MTTTTATMLSRAALEERGWTPTMIDHFLGAPDVTRANPHYKSGAPMRLYAESRVIEAEGSAGFGDAVAKAKARRQTGQAVATRKEHELVERARAMEIDVERLDDKTLVARAIRHYNGRSLEREDTSCDTATVEDDPAFLARIVVNYARHHLTAYDTALEETAGKIGVDKAVRIIRQRVYLAIAEAYPSYAGECRRQMKARGCATVVLKATA